MHTTKRVVVVVLASALLDLGGAACSGPSESLAPSADGGSDGGRDSLYPPLPKECDETLAETVIPREDIGFVLSIPSRLRVAGDAFYVQHLDGIHRTTFPSGTDALLFPSVTFPVSPNSDQKRTVPLGDFWIDATSLTGVLGEAVYAAPIAGGALVFTSGTPPSIGNAPDQLAWNSGTYARSGADVYHAVRDPHPPQWTTPAIRKVSLSGGAPVEFLPLPGQDDATPVFIDADFIYYVSGEDYVKQALSRSPLATPQPEKLAEGFFGGYIAGIDRGSIYVAEDASPYGKLWRVRADRPREEMKVPEGIFAWSRRDIRISDLNQGAVYDGALYLVMRASYQLPDDRRHSYLYVVVRVLPDSDKVELVRCLPEPLSAVVPREDLWMEIGDIQSSDSGVYVSTVHVDGKALNSQMHIYRVAP